MNRILFRIIPAILVSALLAAGCQELSVDVEPVGSTTPPAATLTVPIVSIPKAPTVPAVETATVAPSLAPTTLPGHLQPGTPLRIADIHMIDASQGWAIGSQGAGLSDALLRTGDGAATWRDVTPPLPGTDAGTGRQALGAFSDAQHAWVSYADQTPSPQIQAAEVWYTADGGASWQASQPLDLQGVPVEGFTPGFLGFLDAQHGWLLAHVGAGMNHDYVVIFTSADGGQTWTRMVDPEKNNLQMSCRKTGLVFQTAQIGYLTGDCMGVAPGIFFVRTQDGGATWQDVSLDAPEGFPNLFSNQNNTCGIDTVMLPSPQDVLVPVRCGSFAAGGEMHRWLYTSQDGGQSFHALPLPAQYGSFDFINAQEGWLIGSFTADAARFTLFHTADGGATWKAVADLTWSGTPDFIDAHNGWVAAQSGESSALVRTTDGGTTWQEIKPQIGP